MTKDFKYSPEPGYTFWLYDPEIVGMTFYRTAAARDAAAKDVIEDYRDSDGAWSDEVEGACAGVVTHTVQCKNKVMRPPPEELDEEGYDSEGTHWDDRFDWQGSYTLEPIAHEDQGEKE